MKYIDKNKPDSVIAAKALHDWRDNYINRDPNDKKHYGKRFKEVCHELTPKEAWKLLSNKKEQKLRTALSKEQGYICCYCGRKINGDAVIEHFLPKGKDICERTYNYENLLLACDGNKDEGIHKTQVSRGDTWETLRDKINKQYSRNITVETLKSLNAKIEQLSEGIEIKFNDPRFCDASKDNTEITIHPAQDKTCWERFEYFDDGTVKGMDKEAEHAIKVLNLNASILEKDRKDAWSGFEESLETEIDDIIKEYDPTLDFKQALALLFDAELTDDKTYHLCVVKRSFMKKEIERLF